MKDSGVKQQFETGAQRDAQNGKGRYDLVSPRFLRRLALVMEKGARKYGDRNWEKGFPLGRVFDSLTRHLWQWAAGLDDEDHLGHAAVNLMFLVATEEMAVGGTLPATLLDMGPHVGKQGPPRDGPPVTLTLPEGWFGDIGPVDGGFEASVTNQDHNVPWFRRIGETPNMAWINAIAAARASTHWPANEGEDN